EIVQPADMSGDTDFKAAPELADRFTFAVAMLGHECLAAQRDGLILFPAAKDGATAGPGIGRKARATDRIPQGKSSQYGTNHARILISRHKETTTGRGEVKMDPLRIDSEPLHTEAEVLVPEEL